MTIYPPVLASAAGVRAPGQGSWSGNAPLLVGTAVAGPDLQLGAIGGIGSRVVKALAGRRVHQRAIHRLPLLVAAAGAGPLLDKRAVGRAGAGDIHAVAVDSDGAIGLDRPVLRGTTVAVPHLELRAVGA